MDGSITSLGPLIAAGALRSALVPAVTVRSSRTATLEQQREQVHALLGMAASSGPAPLAELGQAFSEVQAIAARLSMLSEGNVFDARAVLSANEAAITGTAHPGTARQDFMVRVAQVASAQMNLSSGLGATATTSIVPGANALTITSGGASRTVTFEASATSTNLETLNAMAARINAADFGAEAAVRQDGTTLRLELRAATSGAEAGFTITDTAGNAVTALAADTVVVEAGDAEVEVNGVTVTSPTNTVELGDGAVTLQVQQTTAAPVSVAVASDVSLIVEVTQGLADKLNTLADQIERGDPSVGQRARAALVRPIRRRAEILEQIGIQLDRGNRVKVDAERLARAIRHSPETVEARIGGPKGFATVLAEGLRGQARGSASRGGRTLDPSRGREVFGGGRGQASGLMVNLSA